MSEQSLPQRHAVRNIAGVHYAHYRSPESQTFRRQIRVDYGLIATRWPLPPASYRVLMWLLTQRVRRGFTQQLVADELGYTREAVTKSMSVLERHGFMSTTTERVKFDSNHGGAQTYMQTIYRTFETPLINEEFIRKSGGFVMAQENLRSLFGDRAVDSSLCPDEAEETSIAEDEVARVDAVFESHAPIIENYIPPMETLEDAMSEIESLAYPAPPVVRPSMIRMPSNSLRDRVSRMPPPVRGGRMPCPLS
jgi:type IV secretory pathway VirB4 component